MEGLKNWNAKGREDEKRSDFSDSIRVYLDDDMGVSPLSPSFHKKPCEGFRNFSYPCSLICCYGNLGDVSGA
jgi:hypothetical protein